MKLRLLAIAICSIALSAFAEVISPEEALARVMKDTQRPMSNAVGSTPKLIKTETAGNLPTLYIYSTEDRGYMVLSADDQTEALLAYGSNFDGQINPSMQWLLGEYSKEIEGLRSNPIPQRIKLSNDNTLTTTGDRTSIAPMVTTKWNQGEPYNNMCPEVDGSRCVSGCVATAMAQVINYHRIPTENGNGIASYEWEGQTLSFDFGNNSFDWDNMLDEYTSSATQAQQDAVAKLMYACGVSVSMGYGVGASGAVITPIPNALINHFGFDKSVHIEDRVYYTVKQWNDFMYSQLTDYGPVLLAGANYSAGHMFVCDGYSADNFFHINWGWGGSSDGYFKLSALDPSDQGIGGSTSGYNASLSAIANVSAPREGSSYHQSMIIYQSLGITTQSASLGSSITITGGFYNHSTTDLACSIGLIAENVTTNKTSTLAYFNTTLMPNYGYQELNFRIPTTIADGSYKIYPAWKTEGSDWKKMLSNMCYADYINMTVSNSMATFSVDQGAEISANDVQLETPIVIGHSISMQATVSNQSARDYYGYIFAALLTTDSYTAIATGNVSTVEIESGSNKNITYTTSFNTYDQSPLNPGQYYLVIANQNGYIISPAIIVEVREAPNGSVSVSTPAFIGDSNNADRYNLEFSSNISAYNGDFYGTIDLIIFEVTSNNFVYVNSLDNITLYINNGESLSHTFQGAMPSLKVGGQYIAVAFLNFSQQLTGLTYFKVGATSGIEDIEPDNQVLNREYYTITGVKVDEENITSGLYIVIETMSNGETKKSKRLIQ